MKRDYMSTGLHLNRHADDTAVPLRRRALLAAAAALLPLPALAQVQAQATGARIPRNVVATVAMVGDAVREVCAGRVAATTLVGEGVDPHLFRPTRADIARLLGADAVFGVGHRLEGRMGDVLERVRAAGKPVVLMAETLPRAQLLANPDYPDAADPHVWMDPTLWGEAAGSLLPPLAAIAPDLREGMADGLAQFRARCARLDAYTRDAIATVPEGARVLVTAHDAFSYFGRRYGLEIESIQGLSTEAEANLAGI
jgi:manganese/zinc/iron transport system substrate-binding protein